MGSTAHAVGTRRDGRSGHARGVSSWTMPTSRCCVSSTRPRRRPSHGGWLGRPLGRRSGPAHTCPSNGPARSTAIPSTSGSGMGCGASSWTSSRAGGSPNGWSMSATASSSPSRNREAGFGGRVVGDAGRGGHPGATARGGAAGRLVEGRRGSVCRAEEDRQGRRWGFGGRRRGRVPDRVTRAGTPHPFRGPS
jgi:hypothetical protein